VGENGQVADERRECGQGIVELGTVPFDRILGDAREDNEIVQKNRIQD
tara:strand:- start:2074 stop:2217 length:144 start_codon:yes stop_codon:yes gene_type:complete